MLGYLFYCVYGKIFAEIREIKRSNMSQIGEFSQGQGQNRGWHEVSATREIRYKNNTALVMALGILALMVVGLATYIVMDKIQEIHTETSAKTAETGVVETQPEMTASSRGTMLQTQYGKLFLLTSGDLYYLPNSGVKFAADALPGEAGRYIIEEGDVKDFTFPASVVGNRAVTTNYVFDGYRVLPNENIDSVRELETNDVVGARSFLITTDKKKQRILTITLGSVQRTLVYDEVEQIIYPENTEVGVSTGKETVPVGSDSEDAKQAADEALKEAQDKVDEPIKVIKRIPRIETSMGEARAQVIEL